MSKIMMDYDHPYDRDSDWDGFYEFVKMFIGSLIIMFVDVYWFARKKKNHPNV